MNRTRFSVPLAAMSAAMYTSGFRTAGIDCTDINLGTGSPPFALRGIGYNSDGNDTSLGAGGTDIKQPDGSGGSEEAKEAIVDSNAGTGQQMQAQTSDAVAPGSELSTEAGIDDANKVNDGSEAGLDQTAIKDPPAGTETQQV